MAIRFAGTVNMLLLVLAAILPGCAVEIKAQKVTEQATNLSTPGIHYALPRTALDVAVPITYERRTRRSFGAYYGVCADECSRGQDPLNVCRFEFEAEHINFGYAVPTFRSVPDPAQRYAVTVGTSPFTTANVTLNLTDEGILTGASNTYTDKTFETVVGVIGKIAKSIIKEAPPRLDLPDRKDPKVVCEQAKEVRREIELAAAGPATSQRDWNSASLHDLIDHIVTAYHEPLREELPRLEAMAARGSGNLVFISSVNGHAPQRLPWHTR